MTVLALWSVDGAAGEGSQGPVRAEHAHATLQAMRAPLPPVIDGRLSDEVWSLARPAASFTQRDPDEGKPASERTEVRVLYDDDALYVCARLFDSQPALISRRLSKRDDSSDADQVTIYLDPLLDHLTGVSLRVSASGVQRDSTISNDTFEDSTWDAVWQSAVSIDEEGWSAEVRIPLSQLRFKVAEQQTWGINVERYIRRKNETTWLEFVPKQEAGLASRMAHIDGFDGFRPKTHVQALPYTAARTEFVRPRPGDPFNDGSRGFGAAGVDVKWGITSTFTLDGTINPDFGQVEVDPAVVNLSAFETFFQEKRPFFLEGSQIFNNFGSNGANSNWGFNTSDPQIFYSRRIGRSPQLQASGDFVDPPTATTILGAAKLTGKTPSGWSVGLVNAVTDREFASTATGSVRGESEVEPLTNYFVARVQRDVGRRGGLGVMTTAVTRSLRTPALGNTLSDNADIVGGDGYWFLSDKREWVVNGKLAVSRISGSTAAITRAQRASQRYYQRPDASHVSLDPNRKALAGFAGRTNLNRNSGLWQVNASLWGVSPGFESNDLGFMGTSDRAGGHVVFLRRYVTPDRFTRSKTWWVAKSWTWNFNQQMQSDAVQGQASFTFLNYWYFNGGGNWFARTQDDRQTRGGPSMVSPSGNFWNLNGGTDSRRWLSLQGYVSGFSNEAGSWNRNVGMTVNLKPSPMLTISTGPQLTRSLTIAQYVRTVADATAVDTYGERDVFGSLDQTQLSMTTRVNAILTPKVSLQVYMQPLLAVGRYSSFRELARPRTFDFRYYGSPGTLLGYDAASQTFTADPDDVGPAAPFTFRNPDFNFKSLRVNTVFRWELRPGSAFYAVWTRQQQDQAYPGDFTLGRDAGALFSAPGDDVFLVKIAYWIGR
ncbi:MAG: hypothetical protein A3G76_11375 [Acidobacteria bacterium RIFCSPLOWO2_12_FULL_65_11]|nr:MAG: hypothetical protein A3G76_11375 [Acidobacteria bacterium RIFCSPLOWO2_12_FULL_65_11]